MKRSFILAAFAVATSVGLADNAQAQGYAADLMPPYEVSTIITSMGMRPLGRPAWRAGRYFVAAVDRYGREVNVVLDARDGQVIAVRPMAGGYGSQPQYGYDPRYAPPPAGYPRQAPYDPRFGPPPPPPPGDIPNGQPPSDDDEFFDNERQQSSLQPHSQRPLPNSSQHSLPQAPGAPRGTTAARDLPTGSVPRRVSSLAPKDSAARDATPMPRPRPALARANDPTANGAKPDANRKAAKPQPEIAAKDVAAKDAPKAPSADPAKKDIRVIDMSKPEAKAAPRPDEAIRF